MVGRLSRSLHRKDMKSMKDMKNCNRNCTATEKSMSAVASKTSW
jgi:hypothetical protein